ncbi:chitin synthetase [Fimicolochytrium jonesii]|uniref:chitin synthetase n=1 Tax=Fimicolochytrium jonesii TaxID=1396493 RepID=UPI0022FE47A3|nr:chitin synthetase [Fimicolochytrium jonesii]KAI8822864.1 chitin synthetase [Fimicolochytrium jonesii]
MSSSAHNPWAGEQASSRSTHSNVQPSAAGFGSDDNRAQHRRAPSQTRSDSVYGRAQHQRAPSQTGAYGQQSQPQPEAGVRPPPRVRVPFPPSPSNSDYSAHANTSPAVPPRGTSVTAPYQPPQAVHFPAAQFPQTPFDQSIASAADGSSFGENSAKRYGTSSMQPSPRLFVTPSNNDEGDINEVIRSPKKAARGVTFAGEAVRAANRLKNGPLAPLSPPLEMTSMDSNNTLVVPGEEEYSFPASSGGLSRGVGTVRKRKTVKLPSSGNFTITEHHAESLLARVAYNKGSEFETIKYTAATCDPDDFVNNGYTLRTAQEYHRDTEIAIVITSYNETIAEINRTLFGVFQNIQHFCQKRKYGWDVDGWKKIVVVIVSDGRKKCDPSFLLALQTMGIYVPGLEQQSVNKKPTTAHIYESTSQIVLDPDLHFWSTQNGIPPVQTIFVLKEQNLKKINSHRYFFNAICPLLKPKICLLLDVGTRPLPNSIYKLWKAFERDPNCAGACGEIRCQMSATSYFNPLVAAQNFEYKVSNNLDKSLESVFGYIGVLPGAFSAYRYTALLDNMPNRGPLASYFKGEVRPETTSGTEIFAANLYLAEDRILALELCVKPQCQYTLKYVASSAAETDVPDSVPEFISQRRRWLNGSFFAQVYALSNVGRMMKTRHSPMRKLVFIIQAVYSLVSLLFSWFGPAQFAIIFYFLFTSEALKGIGIPQGVGTGLFLTYPSLCTLLFIASLGNRPQASKTLYKASMVFFAFIGLAMLGLLGAKIASLGKDNKGWGRIDEIGSPTSYVVGIGATWGTYLIGSLMHGDALHLLTCSVQYIMMLPSFINVLQIYAFCNLHDVSWGTKGDNVKVDLPAVKVVQSAEGGVTADIHVMERQDLECLWQKGIEDIQRIHNTKAEKAKVDPRLAQEDAYKSFRTNLLLCWLISNVGAFAAITQTKGDLSDKYIVGLLFFTAGLSGIRIIGVVLYQLFRLIAHINPFSTSTLKKTKGAKVGLDANATASGGQQGGGVGPDGRRLPPGHTLVGNKWNGYVVVDENGQVADYAKVFIDA